MSSGQDQQPVNVLPSFPHPPPFYKLYNGSETGPLPPDPPPPPQGTFMLFGLPFDTEEPPVAPLQGRRLYNQGADGSVDLKGELSRLNAELLFVYAELLRALVEQPDNYSGPLNTLNQILANMQHLVNMFRPKQARASLVHAYEMRIEDKREAISSIKSKVEAIDKCIAGALRDIQEAMSNSKGDAEAAAAEAAADTEMMVP